MSEDEPVKDELLIKDGPPVKDEPLVKTTFNCESCKTVHPLEKAIRCEFCNINDESEDETDEAVSVDSWDGKIKHLFCKKCTLKCDACEVRGCKECVEFACCDCGYNMCYECRNNEIDCGCYGHCCSCGVDVNRGSEGWPCGECDKWYCHGCRQCDNPCKECGPETDSEEDDDEDSCSESETVDKPSVKCQSCEKVVTLKNDIPCELGCRPDDKDLSLCKKCSIIVICNTCGVKGCKECVELVCFDCGYDMCIKCRDNQVDCGCYGHCYSCGVDVSRSSEGLPCGECKKWYCHDCRQCDNPCKKCGPESESKDQ